ncbi:hypothetical protein WJX81_008289 [Elliptochloris bilobata]|uniref:Regulatory protein RecX n=1 Tax=Elliptochloris bilobata TaxID=381761 RepID=A0AAW1SLQ8_9CHLO
MPYDKDPHDPWGKDSDVEDDYSPPLEKQFDNAKASAAASLSYRPHSRAELKLKLRDKGFDSALAARALDRLEELGMLSDAQFAETFARSKWRQARWAPSRIRMELLRRGLAKADIETGLHAVFGSNLNSVTLCPPDAEECDLDDAVHEPERLDRQLLEAGPSKHLSKGQIHFADVDA